jgi:hypothetical protein
VSFPNITRDGTNSISIYGAQLEAGSTPSSYIPTNSGATVTRAAETLTVPAANLPWPSPVVIGEELVTNGTFDTDTTGWGGDNANLLVNSQRLEVENSGATQGRAFYNFATEVGKIYQASIDVFKVSGEGNPIVRLGTGIGDASYKSASYAADESVSFIFVATTTNTAWTLYTGSATSGYSGIFDNISVREINPLSVSIQMQGRMTYADTGNAEEVYFARWYNTSVQRIGLYLRTDGAYTGSPTFLQYSGVLDAVGSGVPGLYTPGVNVPFNIASRHGSTFINGAVDGVALTADTTPTALPDLSATDLNLGYDMMGTIKLFRMWSDDLADAGIEEASA